MCSIFLGMRMKPDPPKKGAGRPRRPVPPAHLDPDAAPSREEEILAFIAGSVRERGYPPTIREIGKAFGIASTNGVRYYLDRLEQSGKIRRDRWTSRGIELQAAEGDERERPMRESTPARLAPVPRRSTNEPVEIPLLGRVAAGAPILAEENIEDVLLLDGALVRPGRHFALKVRGDSMKNAGIFDGDIVIVRSTKRADDGDIVAALLPGPAEDEATIKRLRRRDGRVMLVPENPALEPFEMTDGQVLGKVVSVLRKL